MMAHTIFSTLTPVESETSQDAPVETLAIELDRSGFMARMIAILTGSLQDVIGTWETRGYISTVGNEIGDQINTAYCRAMGSSAVPRNRISKVLVDLKRRIGGDFYLISETDDEIVLGNRKCPFAENAKGRPSLCMMTSNVFGVIAAESVGYARVHLEQTIAAGDDGCRVRLELAPEIDDSITIERDRTREYFKA